MRKKVKPPSIQVTSSTLSSTVENNEEPLKNHLTSKEILNEEDEKEKTLTFNSSIENDEKTTKKEPTKRVFAKRGEQNRSHSTCTPSFLPFSSSSSSTKTPSVSPLACPITTAVAASAEAQRSIKEATAEIPEETLSTRPSNFESITDSNNNNQSDLKVLSVKATKSSQKPCISKTEFQSFSSSKYSVAGSQISLISNVMDRIEKGKHLDESLASNRRLPDPLDEKKIATYAGIIALCVLTIIILGIAAFMFLMT